MKRFEEFMSKKIVKIVAPNLSRARDLFEESERKRRSLDDIVSKVGLSDENANDAVEYCYDIILSLIRAKLCIDGLSSSGEGAHEAEVAYMVSMGFSEIDAEFMDELRYFRNGVKYYGKRLHKKYALKAIKFMEEISAELKKKFSF